MCALSLYTHVAKTILAQKSSWPNEKESQTKSQGKGSIILLYRRETEAIVIWPSCVGLYPEL